MTQLIASSKNTIVVGLGVTGLSVVRYLHKAGKPFVVADTREQPPMLQAFCAEFPDVALQLGPLDADALLHAEQVVLSPGLSRADPAIANAVKAGVEVIGDIELFAREAKAPFVAITGSNGKSTVTTLVAAMAEAAGVRVKAGGNLGTPALDLLDDECELYVLELSSFQLESTVKLNAAVASVLNVSADHMDRYASMAHYHLAKQRVYFGAGAVVANRDDALTRPPLAENVKHALFGLGEPDLKDYGLRREEGGMYLARGLRNLLPVDALALKGRHNIANALAALAIGELAGLPEAAMLECLQRFQGLPHRCQQVAQIDGVTFINDSKATNVGAAVAALDGLVADGRKNIILIAGGDGKGADFSDLKPALTKTTKALVVIGRDGAQIAALADDDTPVEHAASMQEAVELAQSLAAEGDVVLLSPACASFDMFKNYEDRGHVFTAAVESLAS